MPKGKESPGAAADASLNVTAWCAHCLDVAMPAQRNGTKPKYSEDALQAFRVLVREHVNPRIGTFLVAELDKKAIANLIAKLPTDEVRAKVLNVLTRVMELAEIKGKRRRGTNPCKGVVPRADPTSRPEHPQAGTERPANWREEAE